MPPFEHTDEDMRTAWAERKMPGWPPEFERAMADPWIARLVRMHADLRARRRATCAKQQAALAAARASTSRVSTKALPLPQHPPLFDRKRAASGERDDD